jgi:hypothetical protein
MSEIIDRVESKRIEKQRKVFLFCGIGMLIISALQIPHTRSHLASECIDKPLADLIYFKLGRRLLK